MDATKPTRWTSGVCPSQSRDLASDHGEHAPTISSHSSSRRSTSELVRCRMNNLCTPAKWTSIAACSSFSPSAVNRVATACLPDALFLSTMPRRSRRDTMRVIPLGVTNTARARSVILKVCSGLRQSW